MLSQDTECHVVNTASIAGLLSSPHSATYQVTKHAVVALSEHLYQSLAQQGAKVKASVLCPGFIRTRILSSSRNRPVEFQIDSSDKPLSPENEEAMWTDIQAHFEVITPEQAADTIFTAIKEERFYIYTHTEFNEFVKRRMENIVQGQNPTVIPVS